MCRVLRVSSSGFYAWRERPPSQRAQQDAVILQHLRVCHARSDGTYGAPRLIDDLRDLAIHVGQKRGCRKFQKVLGSAMVAFLSRLLRIRRGPILRPGLE